MASIYAGVNREIPAIREKISDARLTGSQSPEDIEEAEEALARMESPSEMLRLNYPDLTRESPDLPEDLENQQVQDEESGDQ